MWQSDDLHFDSHGKLLGDETRLPFTLSGLEVKTITLQSDKLLIDGERMGLEFRKDVPRRVVIKTARPRKPEKVHIESDASTDYSPALNAIFTESLADLVPDLPAYWQWYARKHLLPIPEPGSTGPHQGSPAQVGAGVLAPKLTYSPKPEFNSAARALRASGESLVSIVVNAQGTPEDVVILRPMGIGMDEQAIDAVHRYTFKPATKDGQPVAVEVNIDVHFRIY